MIREEIILKSIERKLGIIGNCQMSEDEIQKSFTKDELNLIEKSKYIRREGVKGNYKYIYEEHKQKEEKKLEVGQTYHSPAQDGGEAIDWTITSIDNGKYTIETYNKEGRKGSHTFDEKTLKELISESKPKFKKSFDSPEHQVAQIMKSIKEGQLKDEQGNTITDITKAFEIVQNNIEKSQKANIGDTHIWNGKKFKKQPNGKWLEVSENYGKSKKEHDAQIESIRREMLSIGEKSGGKTNLGSWRNSIKNNETAASKLSDKEHTDEEVGLGNEKIKKLEKEIEKSQKANVGDIHIWNGKKFKKQPNGKWLEVSEQGFTKKQLEYTVKTSHTGGDESNFNERDRERSSKLSDKEHTDEEVGLGDDIESDVKKARDEVKRIHKEIGKVGYKSEEGKKLMLEESKLYKEFLNKHGEEALIEMKIGRSSNFAKLHKNKGGE